VKNLSRFDASAWEEPSGWEEELALAGCSKSPSSKAAAIEEARRILWVRESLNEATCLREAASAKAGNEAG